ncbi:MAG: terminase small subunit [Pseudomonadota bacterium]
MPIKKRPPQGKAAPKKAAAAKTPKKPVTPVKAPKAVKAWKKPEAVEAKAPVPAIAESSLTVKQEAFVMSYLGHGNASRAYRECYDAKNCKPGVVWTEACLLLQNPKVAKRVREARALIADRLLMTKADVIAETTKLATFDVRRLFDENGAPIPFHELDADTAACIVGIEVLEEFEGTGKDRKFIGYTKKYKVADKKGALEMLAKHHGLFEKDNEQQANPILELLKAMGGKSAFGVVKDKHG